MKTALIAMANGTEDIEAITTLDILNRAGIKVTTASVTSDNTRRKRSVLCPGRRPADGRNRGA